MTAIRSEVPDPGGNPMKAAWHAYICNLDALAQGRHPVLAAAGRCNLEVMRLTSQRARAWLELTPRLSSCRTPQQAIGEIMQFWQTAASQYADSSQRLAGALQALTPQGWGDDGTAPKAETRDHMTVSGEPASREAGDPHPHKDRRAA